MNIMLFGFKKCGKVYLGMKLAQKLGWEFIESNHLLAQMYAEQYEEDLEHREIEEKHGFEFYCEYEKKVVSHLVQKNHFVVALGGGVVLNPRNVIRLKETGPVVYLKASKELLKQRILSGDIPHYLDANRPAESFDHFYEKRSPLYHQVGGLEIPIEDYAEDELLQKLVDLVKSPKESVG